MHRLFALFLEYKGGDAVAAESKPKKFEITSSMLQAFGGPTRQVCRQANLHPRIKRSVDEFQSTPAYKAWREKIKKPSK